MEILIDTNFVLTCVKQKIDFVSIANEKIGEEIKWIVPNEVVSELKELSSRAGLKGKDKDAAKLTLSLLDIAKPEYISIKNKYFTTYISCSIKYRTLH
jgi:rRNA-processing protein FCF1